MSFLTSELTVFSGISIHYPVSLVRNINATYVLQRPRVIGAPSSRHAFWTPGWLVCTHPTWLFRELRHQRVPWIFVLLAPAGCRRELRHRKVLCFLFVLLALLFSQSLWI
jgi:hypothetical protein